MTKQEINEYLAEKLFSLKVENVDKAVKILTDGGYMCGIGKLIKLESGFYYDLPNYISNYQPVLERLEPIGEHQSLYWSIERIGDLWSAAISYNYLGGIINGMQSTTECCVDERADTLGEAICRVAVEYLQTR